jgi:hypothetical protein
MTCEFKIVGCSNPQNSQHVCYAPSTEACGLDHTPCNCDVCKCMKPKDITQVKHVV